MMDYALLVGLSKYPSIGDLKGPVNDLADVERWLTEDLHLPAANIKKFTDVPTKFREPKVSDFEDWVNDLEESATVAGSAFPFGDRLYIYFAGHGYNATTAQQALILPRSTPALFSALPMVPLREGLRLRAYFREIVLIYDACRSVLPFAPEAQWNDKSKAAADSGKVKTFSVFASKSGKPAKEMDFGDKRWVGVLTKAFLLGAQGYAADEHGVVYAHKLKAYLYAAVRERLGMDNEPEVEDPSTDEEPWALFQAAQKLPRIVIRPVKTKVGKVQLSRRGGESEEIDLADGVQVKEVPRGYYVVKLPDGSEQEVIAVWEEKVVEI